MNTPEPEQIDCTVEVLTTLGRELKAQYRRREARLLNNTAYDAKETWLHFDPRGHLGSILDLQKELRRWKRRIERDRSRTTSQNGKL